MSSIAAHRRAKAEISHPPMCKSPFPNATDAGYDTMVCSSPSCCSHVAILSTPKPSRTRVAPYRPFIPAYPHISLTLPIPFLPCSLNSPLLMLRILTTNNIHMSALLPPHALAPIAQLLDRAAHLHAPCLLQCQTVEARCQVLHAGGGL